MGVAKGIRLLEGGIVEVLRKPHSLLRKFFKESKLFIVSLNFYCT
jgi:hypothetical protein